MKKIKTYNYLSAGKMNSFELEIKISTDFNLFFNDSEIPKELSDKFTGCLLKQNKFESFDSLNEKVLSIVADYEATFIEETRKKVILYHMDHEERRGQALAFNYLVATRIDTGRGRDSSSRYFTERLLRGKLSQKHLDEVRIYDEFPRLEREDPSEIAWTQEREAWFENMTQMIRELGVRFVEGFGNKPEVLAMKIDQAGGQFLLKGSES